MILVADNLTVTNPIVEMALKDMNPEPIRGWSPAAFRPARQPSTSTPAP
jgi:hypothetical protein